MDFRFGIKTDDDRLLNRLYRRRGIAAKRGDLAAVAILDGRINSIVRRMINPVTSEYRGLHRPRTSR